MENSQIDRVYCQAIVTRRLFLEFSAITVALSTVHRFPLPSTLSRCCQSFYRILHDASSYWCDTGSYLYRINPRAAPSDLTVIGPNSFGVTLIIVADIFDPWSLWGSLVYSQFTTDEITLKNPSRIF